MDALTHNWINGMIVTLILGSYSFTLIVSQILFRRYTNLVDTMPRKEDMQQLSCKLGDVSDRLDTLISAILQNKLSVTMSTAECVEKKLESEA